MEFILNAFQTGQAWLWLACFFTIVAIDEVGKNWYGNFSVGAAIACWLLYFNPAWAYTLGIL